MGFFASRGRVKLQAARAVQGLPDDSDSGTTQEKASPCIVTVEEGERESREEESPTTVKKLEVESIDKPL